MSRVMSAPCLPRLCLALLAALIALPLPGQARPYEEAAKKHSWFSLSRPRKSSAADQLAYATALRDADSLRAAGKQFHALVMTWPGSPEAPEAQLNYARVLDQRGLPDDAFDEYQLLLEKYPGRFDYAAVLQRQMEIALEVGARRRLAWFGLRGFAAPERAIPLLEKVIRNGPAWSRAAEAQFFIGDAYERSGQEDLAVAAYLLCEERYPDSPFTPKAALGRARCWYALALDTPNDEATLEEAYAATISFLNRYSSSSDAESARNMRKELYERRAKLAFDQAVFYDKAAKKPAAALRSYESLLRAFPASSFAARAEARAQALRAQKETNDAKSS